MADKPAVSVTIKFRGVTIEGMTVAELKELRDVLNTLVGEKVTERVIERHEYWPYRRWTYEGPIWTVSGNTSTADLDTPYGTTSTGIVLSCN